MNYRKKEGSDANAGTDKEGAEKLKNKGITALRI